MTAAVGLSGILHGAGIEFAVHAGERCGIRFSTGGRGGECDFVYDGAGHADGKSDCTGGEDFDEYELCAQRMSDIIDIDTGGIITGETSIEQMGEKILERVIQVVSGEARTKSGVAGAGRFYSVEAGSFFVKKNWAIR